MLYLIKYGELALKKQNRGYFEKRLVENITERFGAKGEVKRENGRIFLRTDLDKNQVIDRLKKIFGIVGICLATQVELDLDKMASKAVEIAGDMFKKGFKTFKVETRRPNKAFPYKSPDINATIGARVQQEVEGLSVDVHKPDFIINVEVREEAYIYSEEIPAAGGLPLGTSGKACLLLSGGIDSPVAGWMTMKRGVEIVGIHFHSFPFTSERAKEKVIDLTRVLSMYAGSIKLYVVHFTDIQKSLYENCPPKMMTILMRRMMMRIADRIAKREGALALVTGESIGQVASQTIEAMYVTNAVTDLPVFRPLIGMDKQEIIALARKIGTYDISVLPYEDCCTVFVPKHPLIRPRLDDVEKAEKVLDVNGMVEDALGKLELLQIKGGE
ncbi:tRNA uracil 4-sulfurtransferase ThiI [Caldanaerobius polysaccharolyticus]|uniref:tRNA uracil 4-sulfurtransferase ThiI n=1 Tax=Caldanaerobius polysaccharolyticus TaxID=44256 RepID=UPI00047BD447|nr:tRNA uracil 4-sulfurtransferase ThiI [Caldanaerobius polysaccharolyticus]